MSPIQTRTAGLVLALALASAGGALASEIYKWTDAEGNVHYGDRPAEDVVAERVEIRSRPTDRARVAAAAEARREARERRLGDGDSGQQASDTASPEELRQVAEERRQKCDMYKERLQNFVQSRRLYRQDENGERVYLNEQETQAARDNVQSKVEEYCDA